MSGSIFYPVSMSGFSCTMGACEDNCCRNSSWSMSIDAKTREKYKTLPGELGRLVRDSIEEDGEGRAWFKKNEDGQCPLLDESGLCSLQTEHGAEFLCEACKDYPRHGSWFNGVFEPSLSLSCPEVVRHVLYHGGKTEFTAQSSSHIEPPPPAAPFEAEEYEIRAMLIEALKHERFSITDKLAYMGIFMRTLAKGPKDKDFPAYVKTVIQGYRSNMKTPGIAAALRAGLTGAGTIPREIRNDAMLQIIRGVSAAAASTRPVPDNVENARYYKLMAEFAEAAKSDETAVHLPAAYDRLIVPYVNENPQVFENYLLYTLYDTKLPRGADNYANAYTGFAGEFIAMLLFAAGLFHGCEKLTDREMTAAVYLFHRRISHSPNLRAEIANVFQSDNLPMLISMFGGIN